MAYMTKLDAVNICRRAINSYAIPLTNWTDAYTPGSTYADADERLAVEKVDEATNDLQARKDWEFNRIGEQETQFPYSITADGSGFVIFTATTWLPARAVLHHDDTDFMLKRVEVRLDTADSNKVKLYNQTDQTFVWTVAATKKLVVTAMSVFVSLPQVARAWVAQAAKIKFLTSRNWSQQSIQEAQRELSFAETSINNDNSSRKVRSMLENDQFYVIGRPNDTTWPETMDQRGW
jgi:hypothetical protein